MQKVLIRQMFCFLSVFLFLNSFAETVQSSAAIGKYDFPSLSPYSDFIELPESGLTTPFCAEWNPDFPYRGGQCCGQVPRRGTNSGGFCPAARAKGNFCDEMTPQQREYVEGVQAGKIPDVLKFLQDESLVSYNQSFCSPNNGFLAWGRPLVPTPQNRIELKSPHRCTYFGTDGMVGMLEWVGREIGRQYSDSGFKGVKLVIGDISAPRGGCLKGKGGRRGHSSHMSGQDVDIGFLVAKENRPSPVLFGREFDAELNWQLIKEVFTNPFVCVKTVFLDRALIKKLRRVAEGDPVWNSVSSRIRHIRNHKNHFHVRIGNAPGTPGCVNQSTDDEIGEEEEG